MTQLYNPSSAMESLMAKEHLCVRAGDMQMGWHALARIMGNGRPYAPRAMS